MYAAVSAAYHPVSDWLQRRRLDASMDTTYQIIKLYSCDTLVNTRDDLLGDSSSINVLRVKTIAQS